MRSNKRFYFGLIAGFALITSLASFFLAITPQKAYAVDPALFAEANKICKQIHYTDKDPQLATSMPVVRLLIKKRVHMRLTEPQHKKNSMRPAKRLKTPARTMPQGATKPTTPTTTTA
jgi:hypothetical protein